MNNLTVTFKQGEVGKVLTFDDLSDAAGLVDLTSYTMTLNVSQGSTLVINNAAVTKRDQTTNRGDCYHTLNSTTAAIAPGTYKGELKATAGSNKLFFPTNKNGERTYFTVIVQEPLG